MESNRVEGVSSESNEESFELNENNYLIFKKTLHKASKWVKKEKSEIRKVLAAHKNQAKKIIKDNKR